MSPVKLWPFRFDRHSVRCCRGCCLSCLFKCREILWDLINHFCNIIIEYQLYKRMLNAESLAHICITNIGTVESIWNLTTMLCVPELPFRLLRVSCSDRLHYGDVIMSVIASQIISLAIVYSTVYSGADQRKHQRSASLAFVRGIHRWPVNSPHKWPVAWKMFPFDDVIMFFINCTVGWTNP